MYRAAGVVPLSKNTTQTTVASGSAVTLTTSATSYNVTSISLAAGTWLVWGVVDFSESSATVTLEQAGISATTATLPTQAGGSGVGPDPLSTQVMATSAATQTDQLHIGPTIVTLAATTTIYLVANATFSAGSMSAYGTLTTMKINLA